MPPELRASLDWYALADEPRARREVCSSRDVFQARLDGALRELLRLGWPEPEAALLTAVLGEVGNNSFDHNLGQWRDVAGCWFGREPRHRPPLISGRAPERRGNGLKFVRSVVNGHAARGLLGQSEGAALELGGLMEPLAEVRDRLAETSAPGVAVVLAWELPS